MDIDNHDTFEVVLSKLQRNFTKAICLKNNQETLIFEENSIPDLQFVDYYFLRKAGTLPVYNFTDGKNRYQFFGCKFIKKLIPDQTILLEDYPLLLEYNVCVGENGFCREYLFQDHYVLIKEIDKND